MARKRNSPARLALGLLVAWAAHSAAVADILGPHPGDMTLYEMPDYTLVTIDDMQVRRDIAKLPYLNRAMEVSLGVTAKPTGIPTYVFVVSSSVWERYLEPGTGIISEFVPARFANYVIANGLSFDRDSMYHEHAHLFLYTQLAGAYPLWFNEGLAVMMQNADFSDQNVRFYPTRRTDAGGWISTDRLLRVTHSSPEYLISADNRSFHSQSWIMVHRALVDDAAFGQSVFKYLDALNNLHSIDEAVKSSFNVSVADLDFQLRAYVAGTKERYAKVPLGPVAEAPLGAGRALSNLETLLAISTVALDLGLGIDRVSELLDAADEEPGGKARTRAPRMRLAARQADDASLERLYQELKPQLGDAQLARSTGLALFERVMNLAERPPAPAKSMELMTRSLELLDRSLTAKPDDPEAVWAFATLSAGLKRNIDVAMRRLEPMIVKLPRNPDIATAAALVHDANGSLEDELPCLTAVYTYSHTYEQKRWAAQRIGEVQQKLAASKAN